MIALETKLAKRIEENIIYQVHFNRQAILKIPGEMEVK